MSGKQKKRWVLVVLLMIIVFIGTFVLLLPYLFKLHFVHESVETFIARQVKGDFSFQKGSLSLFPRPCIRIHNAALKTEHGISVAIDTVSAYPNLPSLLLGNLAIERITAVHPNWVVEIPKTEAPSPTALNTLRDRFKAFVNEIAPPARGSLLIEIRQGTLALTQDGKHLFSIQEMESRTQWTLPVVTINISGRSDIWNEGNFAFSFNTANGEGTGQIALNKLTPKSLTDIIFPKNFPQLESAVLDTNITLKTSDFDTLDLSFEVSDPDITLRRGKKTQIVRGKKAAGELKLDKASFHASISDLVLSSPQLQLTGNFDLDTQKPLAGWEANARDVDIASINAATLFFVPWSKTASKIFGTLLEGEVPQISLGQKAQTLDGLEDVSSLYIRGRLNRGTVYVPESDLLLKDTSGDVAVSNGILEASYVKTRLDNSTGSQGLFTLSLDKKEHMPFHVEADVHADIAALPPLLARLSKNRLLSDEMRRITSAEGTAVGRMILDYQSGALDVTVDVSNFNFSAIYTRIPFPISVTGGDFHLINNTIQVEDIRGEIGDSEFTNLSGEISCNELSLLTISKARADADVDEIVSWLSTDPKSNWITKSIRPEKGRISIDSFQLKGPAKSPLDWQFQSEGHITDTFTLLIPLFPEAMFFHQGRYTMTRDKIDFSSEDLSILGARIRATGTLFDYLTKKRRLDAQIEGELGRGSCQWIYNQASIPEMCRWQTPISLSPLNIHWREDDENVNISGEAAIGNGPAVSIAVSKTPDKLIIKNLAIQDKDAQAEITLTLEKNLVEFGFSGTLNGSSLNALLLENDLLAGSIQGNFRARYLFDKPLKSTLMGSLRINGLDTNAFGLPLKISEASLTADRTAVEISTAHFVWNESDFLTYGRIAQIEKGLQLDLDLDSDHLDWAEIKTFLEGDRATGHPHPKFLYGSVRGTCGNFTLNPAMTFQPLQAEFQLNGDQTDIIFHQADTCGISFPGKITLTPDKILFSFEPTATRQALEPTLACLQKGKKIMDGLFDLDGKLDFQFNGTSIVESLEGKVSLRARNGRIYRVVLLGKILSLLDIAGILSGDFPDLEKEGLPYKTSLFKGQFKHGRLKLERGVIDSSGMKIFFEGKEDLVKRKHDLTVFVAPLRTIDLMVEKIPLVNSVFPKGTAIYPIKVTGSWDDPELSLLSPEAVGSEVWGIMTRTLRLPVTLLESIFTDDKKE